MINKKTYILGSIVVILLLIFVSGRQDVNIKDIEAAEDKIKVVTSFYPLYIAALNVTDGNDGVELSNLTQPQTGCLHDYQITAEDMRSLEGADVLIVNGEGIESFLDDVLKQYPDLQIINTTDGFHEKLIEEEDAHDHEDEAEIDNEGHEDEMQVYNGHVWTGFSLYKEQIEVIGRGLAHIDKTRASLYDKNVNIYIDKINHLQKEYHQELTFLKGQNTILFHDAFAYLCQELGIAVETVVEITEDTSFSAADISEIIESIRQGKAEMMIAEQQYSLKVPKEIKDETDSDLYVLDSAVYGEMDKDAYLKIMRKNLEVLAQIKEVQ